MVRKGLVAAVVGQMSWTPPDWIVRIGRRRFAYAVAGLLAVAGGALAVVLYVQRLPEPLRVAVTVTPPAISRMDDGDLVPDSLRLDFRYTGSGADEPPAAPSAARLDLVGERVVEGVELQPPHPGEWRFATENQLVFEPSEDWPAGRAYRVRLATKVFAPGIEVQVADPRGNIAFRTRTRLPDDGLFEWNVGTRPESPTGAYAVRVYLVDDQGRLRALGGASFRVEEYQPDRLRIHASIVDQDARHRNNSRRAKCAVERGSTPANRSTPTRWSI